MCVYVCVCVERERDLSNHVYGGHLEYRAQCTHAGDPCGSTGGWDKKLPRPRPASFPGTHVHVCWYVRMYLSIKK